MRERPILFSGPMVRAIIEGRKTQTRRVVKPPRWTESKIISLDHDERIGRGLIVSHHGTKVRIGCPYGQPGDRLWVRETTLMWRSVTSGHRTDGDGGPIFQDDSEWNKLLAEGKALSESHGRRVGWEVCPSIHMFRGMSRITLEVTNVRADRLQDITDDDAIAEGVELNDRDPWPIEGYPTWRDYTDERPGYGAPHPRGSYSSLWESINGTGSWDANPWVWVVEFKQVTP